MHQQKWFSSDKINVGDVIMFTKNDSIISNSYTYGIVKSLEFGRDGVARKATIRYRNENEWVFRETKRAVRSLVIIHHVDDVDMMKELGLMAMYCDSIYQTIKWTLVIFCFFGGSVAWSIIFLYYEKKKAKNILCFNVLSFVSVVFCVRVFFFCFLSVLFSLVYSFCSRASILMFLYYIIFINYHR